MNMYDFLEVADYDDEDSIDRVIRTWWPKVFVSLKSYSFLNHFGKMSQVGVSMFESLMLWWAKLAISPIANLGAIF